MKENKRKMLFNKKVMRLIGILLIFFFAIVLLWHGNANSNQAQMALVAQVYFDGEYRIGDGEWVNSSSVLLHETVEQHNIQSSKMPIVNAHINAAECAEYGVTNVYPDPINRLTDYNGVMSIYIYNNNKKEKQIGIVRIKIDLTSGNIINKEEEKCE